MRKFLMHLMVHMTYRVDCAMLDLTLEVLSHTLLDAWVTQSLKGCIHFRMQDRHNGCEHLGNRLRFSPCLP